ncbi:Rad9 protein [Teladorsagia circumcincta]|uniref:Rad9 protein n=1 Tax=Teladorsagia circumcincta TaxID=45464 RepID=A0A2G9V1M5_TELCI|nr:Rad9 protein [Teladorsagia circumcincta]
MQLRSQLTGAGSVFSNAIAALSKLGDELFLRSQQRGICLKSFNKTRSAYGIFLFADDFFSDYDTKCLSSDTAKDCRLSMKTALSMFKSAYFVEKNLVSCTLTVDVLGRELQVDFQHTCDVSRSFDVNVMEKHKPFTSDVSKSDLRNAVTLNLAFTSSGYSHICPSTCVRYQLVFRQTGKAKPKAKEPENESMVDDGFNEGQALGDHMLMDDFVLGDGMVPENASERFSEKEPTVSTGSPAVVKKVNVQFQHRFLGLDSRTQHQSQAAAAGNPIVEPTQLPPS